MTQIATIVTLVWKHFTLELIVTDDAVNLTSEKHDLNAQMNHLQKEENKKTLQKDRCGAGQIPFEGQVRNILTTLEC